MKGLFSYDSPIMGALTAIGDCICLSAMWLVFSLPVVTIGASTTAMYAAAYHSIRKKEGALWRSFWGAFQENFKRSTLIWLVELVVMALLTVDVFVLRYIRLSGGAMGILYLPVIVIWCVALTWTVYTAAYAARFTGTVREVLQYGAMLMTLHPIKVFGVLLPLLGGLALTLLVPFMALVTPAAVFVLCSFTTEQVFRLHMRPEDLAGETGETDDNDEENI
ncbi:MAG: YesL family protein [Oscillospiraceae bacterium]|nr:YesL family protein [Oscillospiraceae bacterium]